MRKASTRMLEKETQTPSPSPDLIPAETKNQTRTNIRIGTANGGTSRSIQVLSKPVTGWQVLPADAPDFETASLRAVTSF
jgi:hypothetical protein